MYNSYVTYVRTYVHNVKPVAARDIFSRWFNNVFTDMSVINIWGSGEWCRKDRNSLFLKNFTQFLKEFDSIFMKVSHNVYENFTQFLSN